TRQVAGPAGQGLRPDPAGPGDDVHPVQGSPSLAQPVPGGSAIVADVAVRAAGMGRDRLDAVPRGEAIQRGGVRLLRGTRNGNDREAKRQRRADNRAAPTKYLTVKEARLQNSTTARIDLPSCISSKP
ncbi:hypothetical protein, partial [Sulfitobacter sp. HI0040]|uniref:hypothetical protein n=1 Tax=Sulfitobacter sp. HI0040 TaxID=1822232 RepID=UPI001F1FC3FD